MDARAIAGCGGGMGGMNEVRSFVATRRVGGLIF